MEEAHKDTFKHGNRDWKFTPTRQMFVAKKNAESENKTAEQRKARITGLLQKEKEKRDRLKELEIDYTFPGYKAIVDEYVSKNKKVKEPAVEKSSSKKDKKKKSKK